MTTATLRQTGRRGASLHLRPALGLKQIGFSCWERRGEGDRNVAFPARQYSVNGERRSFALLRPVTDSAAKNRIGDLVLEAYAEYEAQQAIASATEEAAPTTVPPTTSSSFQRRVPSSTRLRTTPLRA